MRRLLYNIFEECGYVTASIILAVATAAGMLIASSFFGSVAARADTEARKKIVIIDSGINVTPSLRPYLCRAGSQDFTKRGLKDESGHGTNIASIIVRSMDPKQECIAVMKFWYPGISDDDSVRNMHDALNLAVHTGPSFINISGGGVSESGDEREMLQHALDAGVVVVVSAGNEGQNLMVQCDYYPACYAFKSKNFHVVANGKGWATASTSNYSGPVTDEADGENVSGGGIKLSGTSQAAAIITGELVVKNRQSK